MKIKTIKFCSLFLYVLLIFQLVSAFPISFSNKNETLIVKDSDAITGLPNRFRDLTNLNISGSEQFTPSQIENIKNELIEKCDNIELEYVSKEKALERFKSNLGENENLLNDFNSTNNPIPASIDIKTDTDIKAIVEYIQNMPGIAHITTHINSNPYELYIQRIMEK